MNIEHHLNLLNDWNFYHLEHSYLDMGVYLLKNYPDHLLPEQLGSEHLSPEQLGPEAQ